MRARMRAEACRRLVRAAVSDDTFARYALEQAVEQYALPVRSACACRWPDRSAGSPHMQHGLVGRAVGRRWARFASRWAYPQDFRQKMLPVFRWR